jgi:hypothetical protein
MKTGFYPELRVPIPENGGPQGHLITGNLCAHYRFKPVRESRFYEIRRGWIGVLFRWEKEKQAFKYDGDFLKISIVCREDAENLVEEAYYGLAVTLEAVENTTLPIYKEIKTRISIPIEIKENI